MSEYRHCCTEFKHLDPVSKTGEWTSSIFKRDELGWPLVFTIRAGFCFGFHIRFCPFCGAEIIPSKKT